MTNLDFETAARLADYMADLKGGHYTPKRPGRGRRGRYGTSERPYEALHTHEGR
jgi:hypothetical protein